MKKSIKILTTAAMLTAISIVIASLCKVIPFLNFGIGLRVTLENMPIIMAGILFGPIVGGCVGLATVLRRLRPLLSVDVS